MISIQPALLALVLLSKLGSHTAAAAAAKPEDVATAAQDDLDPFVGSDEPLTADGAVLPPKYRRGLLLDGDDDAPRVIVLPDVRLRGQRVRGLNPALTHALPFVAERSRSRSRSHAPAEPGLDLERRDTDLDMLRCMIGRVYRPCWEA